MSPSPLHILLIEDDDIDAEYFQRCLGQQPDLVLVRVSDATAALHTLRGQKGYPRLPPPYFILLELQLPGLSGLEFLRLLRGDPALRQSIVFVVNGVHSESEIARAYAYNVAGYFLKDQLAEDCQWLQQVVDTYQRLVCFPPHPG
jgi:CheY-like chemotaxis protein